MCRCRDCDNERSRRYYNANRERKLAAIAAKPRPERKCLHCDRPATSQRHWFCDPCRANGARRRKRRTEPVPPQRYCAHGQAGCAMDHHADPRSPCRTGLTHAEIQELFKDPEAEHRWLRGLHPYYGRQA
jgi:hypothetical protein